MIGQFAILILSIDAPLRMLLDNDQTKEFIPEKLRKQNKYGAFSNGIWLVVILSGAIILIQTGGVRAPAAHKTQFGLYAFALFVGIRSIYCAEKGDQED